MASETLDLSDNKLTGQCALLASEGEFLTLTVPKNKIAGVFTSHDPTSGSGRVGSGRLNQISRVESGRLRRCSKPHGSGQEFFI